MSNQINEGAARYKADAHDTNTPEPSDNRETRNPQQLVTDHLALWTSTITPKSTSGRGRGSGKSSKLELTGIKKLRELILELAVRGKLVAQNPDDEPASKLLERIEAEKAQLVKEGKIKKQKTLPPVSDDEKPFDLPEGWEWVRLGHIAQINPRNQVDDSTHVSFIPMASVSTSYSGSHDHEIKSWSEIKTGFTHFADGDVAIAKITPCFENSKAAIFSNLSNGAGAGTTELHVARPYGFLEQRFVLLVFKSPRYLIEGESQMTGSAGQKRVPKSYFEGTPIQLPPLAEQQRIVAKVDELMALCDQLEQHSEHQLTAHQQLTDTLLATLTESANAQELNDNWQRLAQHFDLLFSGPMGAWAIDRLKDTILQLAVMGKLVPQNPDDEPASKLLERIEEEKTRLVKEGKIKKPKKLPPVSDDEKPFELPEGWEWCRLSTLVTALGDGLHGTPTYDNSGKYFFVNGNNLKDGKIDIKPDTKKVSFEEYQKHQKPLDETTILVSINGTLGNVGFYNNEPVMLGKSACYFNLMAELTKLYFKRLLESQYFLEYASRKATGSTIKNLGLKAMHDLPIAMPPTSEQHRIVAKIDELFALCDQLKDRLQQTSKTEQHLTNAIVEQALS
jgi:type I restriction enzyme S subunit